MKFLRDKISGFSTTQVLGWGASIVIALTSFIWAQIGSTNTEIKEVKTEQVALAGRVITVETNYVSLKEDFKEVKSDVKELLQRIPKK